MSTTLCPHLGSLEDRGTCFSFASPSNCCWRLNSARDIGPDHQSSYCLTPNFTECPVYTSGQAAPGILLRRSSAATPAQQGFNWRWWLFVFEILAVGLLIGGVIAMQWYVPGWSLFEIALPPTATFTPRPTATRTFTPTARPTLVPTATLSPTLIPTNVPTATPGLASPTPGPNASDPVGPLQLSTYTVQRNDTLASLAARYKIKANAIANVNGIDRRANLNMGQNVIIPAGAGDNETLPRLSIFQLATETSLATLAQQLSANADEIRTLNALGPDDFIPAGRLLYIPTAAVIPTRAR